MPQLDTSTWFTTITSMILTLFIIFQLKVKTFTFTPNPTPKNVESMKQKNPWEKKWTKIYLPLLLPLL
uniref:ATP synthase complex subunit 8 n=1 Tax=Castor canadensis TaxID=51338 RepID=E8ZEU7_CASCN|nr:ATP synthase F0 subunit 8 [Castor canadensis]APY18769.1 ATP synthase F0 subunit 8 [Castor canadensis]APZ75700.1 ATP synthase F0 subunit 8 [Castor canadensis]CBX20848.1 atp synthase F0 subunit 8 [Castor canadensis]